MTGFLPEACSYHLTASGEGGPAGSTLILDSRRGSTERLGRLLVLHSHEMQTWGGPRDPLLAYSSSSFVRAPPSLSWGLSKECAQGCADFEYNSG